MEQYHIDPKTNILLNRIIMEWDAHDVGEMEKEGQVCRACPFYVTCSYSTKRKVKHARVGHTKTFFNGPGN